MMTRVMRWHDFGSGREAGAAHALDFYREEISRTLAFLGCRSVAELNRDCLEFVGASHTPAAM